MNIIRDAATLLILALLVISVRVTPLDQVGDLVPSAEAAEATVSDDVHEASLFPAAALPKAAEDAAVDIDVDPSSEADADCPARIRTLRCTTAADGSSRCELELQQVKSLVLPPAGPETVRLITHTCT